MRDSDRNDLKDAVQAVISADRPDFGRVYSRARRRTQLGWTGLAMGLTAAAALTVVLTQPAPAPSFDTQVASFVALVSED